MITLNDFQVLSFDKKCNFITVFGDYLLYRVEGDKKYYLYAMEGFYVEVCYLPKKGKVADINPFINSSKLDAYAESVDISDLFLQD